MCAWHIKPKCLVVILGYKLLGLKVAQKLRRLLHNIIPCLWCLPLRHVTSLRNLMGSLQMERKVAEVTQKRNAERKSKGKLGTGVKDRDKGGGAVNKKQQQLLDVNRREAARSKRMQELMRQVQSIWKQVQLTCLREPTRSFFVLQSLALGFVRLRIMFLVFVMRCILFSLKVHEASDH